MWNGPLPEFLDSRDKFAGKAMYDPKDEPPWELSCLKILEGKSRGAIDIALLIHLPESKTSIKE